MQLNDYSLRQLDDTYLETLGEAQLRVLLVKALEDLKEAREQLNQNSQNSSLPPSHEKPWVKPEQYEAEPSEDRVGDDKDTPVDVHQETNDNETPSESSTLRKPETTARNSGKPKGAPGYGRKAPETINDIKVHAPESCVGCMASLFAIEKSTYTGHYEVTLIRCENGWKVEWIKHLWQESTCSCGHCTRAEPPRRIEDGILLGGFRLIGSGLAALIVALFMRYRMSRRRIREFLGDWLGVWLSVGAIHAVIEEAGVIVMPVEAELIEAVRQSGLLHADETPWPEQGANQASLWMWVFISTHVTLYYISHRGQELTKNLLESFIGTLMSDGWQAYRWIKNRLRCWAHLKRKAVGLTESFNADARDFGKAVLDLWDDLREAVHNARESPPGSIRDEFDVRLNAFRLRCEAMRTSTHKKTRQLAGEFLNDWDAIFAVLDNPSWPLTNNEAERALRHWVILRLITHGTRTERGSRNLALLASVIDTCRQRGHSPWDYLATAIDRRRQNLSLLPLPV